MRNKKNLPLISGIEITDIAAEGKAIARVEGMVIFVPYVLPGDILDVQVIKKRKHYMEAVPVRFLHYSSLRRTPICNHYGICGGCKWQNLEYSKQLIYKERQVFDQLVRIGKLSIPEILPILGSEKEYYYRNKLEYTFSENRWLTTEEIASGETFERRSLGFHIPEKFDKVLDITDCYLQKDPSNAIRNAVKKFALDQNLTFFNLREQHGFLRNLIIRTTTTGELMVVVCFFFEDKVLRESLLNFIHQTFPQVTSLMYVINQKVNDTITDQEVLLYAGKDHLLEKMGDLFFKVGPKSFYQTNAEQAELLYGVAKDFAELHGSEVVYDLYTGTGTIANFIAKDAQKVIGMEYVPEAIEDAKENSNLNNIQNTTFFAGDIKDLLTRDFIRTHGSPDVIVLDPPRSGIHAQVIESILNIAPSRIVYVSCNPATQARDLGLLKEVYTITKIQPVDMFPQTHHVENVVQLQKSLKKIYRSFLLLLINTGCPIIQITHLNESNG